LQVVPHDPLLQKGVAFAPAGQTCPQAPQLAGSAFGSTHEPAQSAGAMLGHPETHEYEPFDPAQTPASPPQALPQLPQLEAVVNWTQAPLHGL
jgi:hypothetical protein